MASSSNWERHITPLEFALLVAQIGRARSENDNYASLRLAMAEERL
jgi:hypothetical protein